MTDLASAARTLRVARSRLDTAMETARQSALDTIAAGATEAEVARELGVDRMTVRKWRGKR